MKHRTRSHLYVCIINVDFIALFSTRGDFQWKQDCYAIANAPAYLHRSVYKLLSLVPMTEMD